MPRGTIVLYPTGILTVPLAFKRHLLVHVVFHMSFLFFEIFLKQRYPDSNRNCQSQSLMCYHYTISHYVICFVLLTFLLTPQQPRQDHPTANMPDACPCAVCLSRFHPSGNQRGQQYTEICLSRSDSAFFL